MFGLVDHARIPPAVRYLEAPAPVTPDLLALSAPLRPTEIFRFAAPCQGGRCCHWSGSDCRLVTRIVELLPEADASLPHCGIRGACRWFEQGGAGACARCAGIVTQNEDPSDSMRLAAAPQGGPRSLEAVSTRPTSGGGGADSE